MNNANSRQHLRNAAAQFLTDEGYKTAPSTLAKYATVGGGPPYTLFGRRPLYKEADLLDWAKSRCSKLKSSTSDKR